MEYFLVQEVCCLTSKPMYCQLTKKGATIFRRCEQDTDMTMQWELNIRSYIWVFPKIGVPHNGWFIMENPIRMDDLGVPLFLETPIYLAIWVCYSNIDLQWQCMSGGSNFLNMFLWVFVLPETNSLSRTENGWLEDDPVSFWVSVIFRGRAIC